MGIDLPLPFQDVNDVLQVVINNEKLENPKITYLQGSKVGEGYLAINSAVEITDGNRTLNLFVKAAPKHASLREKWNLNAAYNTEHHFYSVVLPILEELYRNKTGKSLELTSKFYAGSVEEMKEILVLENLSSKGFALNNEKYAFSKERALLVMKEYGKFHAVSFALKDQDSATFNNITKDLVDPFPFWYRAMGWDSMIELSCKCLEKHLQSAEDSCLLEKLTYFLKNLTELFRKSNEFDGEYSTILHGDGNYNNMMLRNQDNNLELRFIDFQTLRFSSPVVDLCYFFYCSASSEENLAELDLFLKTYYNSLSLTIKELGSDPEKLCPFSIIEQHWKKASVFGLIMATLLMPVMVNDGEPYNIVEEIDKQLEEISEMNNEELYVKRMKHLLRHFIDNNFI